MILHQIYFLNHQKNDENSTASIPPKSSGLKHLKTFSSVSFGHSLTQMFQQLMEIQGI